MAEVEVLVFAMELRSMGTEPRLVNHQHMRVLVCWGYGDQPRQAWNVHSRRSTCVIPTSALANASARWIQVRATDRIFVVNLKQIMGQVNLGWRPLHLSRRLRLGTHLRAWTPTRQHLQCKFLATATYFHFFLRPLLRSWQSSTAMKKKQCSVKLETAALICSFACAGSIFIAPWQPLWNKHLLKLKHSVEPLFFGFCWSSSSMQWLAVLFDIQRQCFVLSCEVMSRGVLLPLHCLTTLLRSQRPGQWSSVGQRTGNTSTTRTREPRSTIRLRTATHLTRKLGCFLFENKHGRLSRLKCHWTLNQFPFFVAPSDDFRFSCYLLDYIHGQQSCPTLPMSGPAVKANEPKWPCATTPLRCCFVIGQ